MIFQRLNSTAHFWPISPIAISLLTAAAVLFFACSSASNRFTLDHVTTAFRIEDKLAEPFGIAVDGDTIYTSDGNCGCIWRTRNKETAIFASGLSTPSMIAIHPDGGLIVADSGSHTIKRIAVDGTISALAGIENRRGNQDGDATSSQFHAPIGVAVDAERRIWITDTYNDRVRLIENGSVRTVAGSIRGFADGVASAAKFDTPVGIAIDPMGRAIVADLGNRRLRIVSVDGNVTTLAGTGEAESRDGSLGNAAFISPTGVAAIDDAIFVTDGNAVRGIGMRSVPLVETISGGDRGFANGKPLIARFNRPSGIAVARDRSLLIADSENGLVRQVGSIVESGATDGEPLRLTADEFRSLAPGRWPYDPPNVTRDIAGTLGEIRGTMTDSRQNVWFHNGLDIAGNYGETARFIRAETVLDPAAVDNFETLRELIRMPTLGYIHIRIGRRSDGSRFDDPRFLFDENSDRKTSSVRVARGTRFAAGDAIGTLNAMNHVHLIAGRRGYEFNALNALDLPGVADSRPPTMVSYGLFDQEWRSIETKSATGRIIINGRFRPVLRAFDQMDGNPERRKLGIYRLGWQLLSSYGHQTAEIEWTIEFDRLPPHASLPLVFANGSYSGATGETIFEHIVSNRVNGSFFEERLIDPASFAPGEYVLRLIAADIFANSSHVDVKVEFIR